MIVRKFLLVLSLVLISCVCLAQSSGRRQLFNGKNLDGWKHVGPGEMVVENGLIRTKGGMGLLYWTGGPVKNCRIRVVYRMQHENDNSGVFIRIPVEPREEWMPVHYGYEVQIDNKDNEFHRTGDLYSFTKALASPGKPGPEWNTMEITLQGSRTIVVVNGTKVTDFIDSASAQAGAPARVQQWEPQRGVRPDSGWIGLQNHSDNDVVFFKEVSMEPLSR